MSCVPCCNEPPVRVKIETNNSCNSNCTDNCCFPWLRRRRDERVSRIALEHIDNNRKNSKDVEITTV